MVPYWSLLDFMGPRAYGFLWVYMGPYGFLRVLIGPYGSLWVLMGFYGSSWFLIGPYGSLSPKFGLQSKLRNSV